MSRNVFTTTLYELNQVTPTMKELKIRVKGEAPFQFKGGQFVMLQVPVEGKEKPEQRAYSVASSALETDNFNLLIKHVPGGLASEYVAKMKVNDELKFTGPWGKCVFKHPAPEQVLFISTGSGLSQHISFLTSDAHLYPNTKFKALIGVSVEEEMYYEEELKKCQALVKNFEYSWCLSKPTDQWTGKKGRVTHFVKDFDFKNIPTHIYLCGSGAMIKDMKAFLLEENNFPKENLVVENFG